MSSRCFRNQTLNFFENEGHGWRWTRREKADSSATTHTSVKKAGQTHKQLPYDMANRSSHTQAPHTLASPNSYMKNHQFKKGKNCTASLSERALFCPTGYITWAGWMLFSPPLPLVRIWNIVNRIQTFYLSPVPLPTYIWLDRTSLIRLKPFWVQLHKVLCFSSLFFSSAAFLLDSGEGRILPLRKSSRERPACEIKGTSDY